MQQRQRRRSVEQDASMNMTPMIDVTFQLLAFFLVTLQFRSLEQKVQTNLPTELGSSGPVMVDERTVTVTLRKSLIPRPSRLEEAPPPRYFFEGQRVPTLEAVSRRLRGFRDSRPDARVKIDAGDGVPYGQVVAVLDMIKGLGYGSIEFVGWSRQRLRALTNPRGSAGR